MTAVPFPDTGVDVDLDLPHAGSPQEAAPLSTALPSPRKERMPLFGIALLCLASAVLGVAVDHRFLLPVPPEPRIAFAEQGAVVLESLLARPDLDAGAARRLVGQSLSDVIEKYRQAGFLVIDVTHSADGLILVDAVPRTAIDITPQMRAAVAQAISRAASAAKGSAAYASATGTGASLHPTDAIGAQR